jgi:A/G-specific adenine glycosylase
VSSDSELQRELLDWYARHQRDLPWRRESSPYRTVISEIMLQQTQVDRVVPAFEAFVQRFPSFEALAASSRADVIRAWAGLGYNRRAVHLHELARAVVERFGGELPADKATLLQLPGVGPYTAGAILSLAFGQDEPALDTNVRRVIGRYQADDRPASVAAAAARLVPTGRASDWNQALMDLGATICLSRRPRCLVCPIRAGCLSAGRVDFAGPVDFKKSGARRQTAYEGSMRYYRGRFLDELRALPAGGSAPLPELAARLAATGVAEPPAGWETVSRDLVRDGLAKIDESAEPVEVALA